MGRVIGLVHSRHLLAQELLKKCNHNTADIAVYWKVKAKVQCSFIHWTLSLLLQKSFFYTFTCLNHNSLDLIEVTEIYFTLTFLLLQLNIIGEK